MAIVDLLRRLFNATPSDDSWADVRVGGRPSTGELSPTPFLAGEGTIEVPGIWTIKVKRVGEAWSLFIDAPHGAQPIAGVDPALRPILERLTDGAELPLVCRLLAGRPNNIRNMVAARLGDDVSALERVANQLPDEVVASNLELLVARFWERSSIHDEAGALADFKLLLAADRRGCANFWQKLSPEDQAATTPALMAWLETRVFGPEDLEKEEGDFEDGSEDPSMSHPRFLHCNELYRLPIHLWPQRALMAAQSTVRLSGSLSFFPAITAEVLLAETQRRAAKRSSS